MTEVIVSIALTTGACAFLFFVLPMMDAAKAKKAAKDPRSETPSEDSPASGGG